MQPVLNEACRIAAGGLGVRYAKVLEWRPDPSDFLMRAGVGWHPGVVGHARLGADLASPAGYAFRTGEPLVSNSLLREKDLLMQEVHHRVKNSLQLVQSLLRMQGRAAADEAVGRQLAESAARVRTIAAVHDRLYRTAVTPEQRVAVGPCLSGLIEDLRGGVLADTGERTIHLEADAASWTVSEVPVLGLVLTELVTNAIRYGQGAVRVFFRSPAGSAQDGRADAPELVVEEEGPGLPAGFDPARGRLRHAPGERPARRQRWRHRRGRRGGPHALRGTPARGRSAFGGRGFPACPARHRRRTRVTILPRPRDAGLSPRPSRRSFPAMAQPTNGAPTSRPNAGRAETPSAADFRALAEALPQLAWMADGSGSIFWYNDRWHDYAGTTLEEMRGDGWRALHHPDHVEAVAARFAEAVAAGEPWEDTFPLRGRDGEYRWFLSRAMPLRDAAGRVVRWFGTNTDVTERRRQDAELFRSERRFRSLVNATAAIVWTTPASGEMEEEQPAWTAFTGQTLDDLRGWGWLEAVHPDDRAAVAESWSAAVESLSPYAAEHRLRRHDGEWRWMAARAAPVLNDRGELREWVGTHTDVSERRRAEEDLAAAKEAAEAANRAKSQFIANMSHELRTPLSAVIGYSEMLEEEVEEMGQTQLLGDLRKINSNARHLLGLISDVLDLSKIEANTVIRFAEEFDVAELVSSVAATVDSLVRKKNNSLMVEADSGLGTMHSDQTKLRQCLFNLLGNAAKFTEGGRIALRASRAREDGRDWLTFRVSDTGIGMTPEQLGRLFQRFSQADESTTRKFGGTGLGLAITRAFAELLGGEITAESEAGAGSAFTIRLPATYHEPEAVEAAEPEAAPADVVLLVDDDAATRDLVGRFLSREGFQVRATGDGRSGLALARSLRPRVILLDVMMPLMDGWSVLSAIRRDPDIANIPVVMISFVNEQGLAASLGATGYLAKPVEWDHLRGVMERYRDHGSAGHGGQVLVVDDDEGSRERLSAMLGKHGWRVATAADGAAGLRAVEAALPALILLDLMMPEMDGFTFLERLRARPEWQAIPVVVVTAKDLDETDRERLEGRVDRVIAKGSVSLRRLAGELRGIVPDAGEVPRSPTPPGAPTHAG